MQTTSPIDLHQQYTGKLVGLDHETTKIAFALCKAVNGARREDGRWDVEMILQRSLIPITPDDEVIPTNDGCCTYRKVYGEAGGVQELLDGGWRIRPHDDGNLIILDRVV